MTDDKSSNSGTTGNSDGAEGSKNQTAKMSLDQAYAHIVVLEAENKAQKDMIEDLTQQLTEINTVVDAQEKAKLYEYILPRSNYKMEEIVGKSTEDLKKEAATLDRAVPPKRNSARVGVMSADLSDREGGLTVGDLSIVTARKRKAAA